MKIFSGSANPRLAQEICDHLKVPLGQVDVGRFSNGEIRVSIGENVRGIDVFVVQPTSQPVNDNLMELLIMIDALRRASAGRITAVVPFYGYARQDRKTRGREPITAKLVANLITVAGANRVLTVDLHAGQIQGFFDVPVDNLSGVPLLAQYLRQRGFDRQTVVVSPDAGGVPRARDMADRLGVGLAILDKRRPEPNVAEVTHVIGDVEGRDAIIVDDMIDTAGTVREGSLELKRRGARRVIACATHPVFSGNAWENLREAGLEEVVVTNTIAQPERSEIDGKLTVLSTGPLLAEAIRRIHSDMSVSALFNEPLDML
ncbi:MAG: ribose-phosphate pyrophosphokinase [Clostridia bacterium]|nr:ribose-phosphate pyrophosphokinase [Clostridia bacterium]MCL6521352.1 ribose-phosphate pyrophosphokinase [Bacillota bacterium]